MDQELRAVCSRLWQAVEPWCFGDDELEAAKCVEVRVVILQIKKMSQRITGRLA